MAQKTTSVCVCHSYFLGILIGYFLDTTGDSWTGMMVAERDTGFVTDERTMLDHLKLMLSGDYIDDSDFDSDDDDDSDDDLSMLAYMM